MSTDDFETFLTAAVSSHRARCAVCLNEKVTSLYDRWLARKLDGSTLATATDVLKFAKVNYDFRHTLPTVYRHLSNCRAEDYKKVRQSE